MSGARDVRFLGPQDREWPAVLCVEPVPAVAPLGLWVRGAGDLADLLRQAVVVLGSNHATPYAVKVAHRLATDLGEAGWTVVTSGATGVASAVRHGVYTAKGRAVVLPLGGIATPRPQAHQRQYERVTWTGLVVSDSYRPPADHRADLQARCRILSAIGAAVVVIEPAGLDSAVVRRARQLGRPVYAVPGAVTGDRQSDGAHRLIRDGAARLVRDASDVLTDLGGVPVVDADLGAGAS